MTEAPPTTTRIYICASVIMVYQSIRVLQSG